MPRTLKLILQGILIIHGLYSSVLEKLVPTLVRDRLIPDQLSVIGGVGALVVLLAILAAWSYQSGIRRFLRLLTVLAFITLGCLVFLQIKYVVTLPGYGSPAVTHYYLVGYKLTESGTKKREAVGKHSLAADIANIGADYIPEMYGNSYYILATVYVFAYLLFIVFIVFLISAG